MHQVGNQPRLYYDAHSTSHKEMHFYIHECVTQTVGCGTSHKYTNIQNFYGVKHHKHVTKHYYRSSSHINIRLQSKRNVYLSIFSTLL